MSLHITLNHVELHAPSKHERHKWDPEPVATAEVVHAYVFSSPNISQPFTPTKQHDFSEGDQLLITHLKDGQRAYFHRFVIEATRPGGQDIVLEGRVPAWTPVKM